MSAYVYDGAPTNIDCFVTESPDTPLVQAAKDHTLISAEEPAVSQVSVGYLIPFLRTPCSIKCVVSNKAGRDSFTCKLKGMCI